MTDHKMNDWWRGCVIYQVYPRSYQDTNGDGVGDLRGITQRLEYIASLGVDAIWISPFFRSPMRDFGYDVSDFCDVDPLFGTLADADALIKKADQLGLRIIVDMVLNHTSDQHPWFIESSSSRDNPKADWYVWADPKPDGTPPNNWLSVFGGSSWQWHTRRKQYYLHNFLKEQPDVNFHSVSVQDALMEIMEFWLKRGVKGFRFDATNFYVHDAALRDNPIHDHVNDPQDHVPDINPYGMQQHIYDQSRPETLTFLARVRALLNRYDAAMGMAELGALDAYQLIGEYSAGDKHLHMGYGFQFLNPKFSASYVEQVVQRMEANIQDGWPCWAFSNHDAARPVTRWNPKAGMEQAFSHMLLSLLLSLRGSVCMYQGEELGLPEAEIAYEEIQDPYGLEFWPEFKGRDGCRTPMPWDHTQPHAGFSTVKPWLPVRDAHQALAVSTQESDAASSLSIARKLIKWRKQHSAMVNGAIDLQQIRPDLVRIERKNATESLIVYVNFSAEPTSIAVSDTELVLVSDHPLVASARLDAGTLHLQGYGVAVVRT
ncbi:MAG: alpha-glucosidase [Alphaproteobacteria bacterium]|nr:MAG: alpha-glucosidase [Alphaproteobacteria bacterium]